MSGLVDVASVDVAIVDVAIAEEEADYNPPVDNEIALVESPLGELDDDDF